MRSTAAAIGFMSLGLGCASSSSVSPASTPDASVEQSPRPPEHGPLSQLEERYLLALSSFNRGDYEIAAGMFAYLVNELPPDAEYDPLRHLLILHIGWSLLGSHDMQLDAGIEPGALARGEGMLEAYAERHEALLPEAVAARAEIYALLAEYGLRRDGEPAPDAHARLEALTRDAYTTIHSSAPETAPSKRKDDDRMVREIVVDTREINWAQLDDPRVQAFFRSGSDSGPSLFDNPYGAFNPTRVLVRGVIARGERRAAVSKRARALLTSARLGLERCYEDALSGDVELVEFVELALSWPSEGPVEVELDDDHGLGPRGEMCVRETIRTADLAEPDPPEAAMATTLELTFFVQPMRMLTEEHLEPSNGLGNPQNGRFKPLSRATPPT